MTDRSTTPDRRGYGPEQCTEFTEQVQHLRNRGATVQIDLSLLAERLTVPRARTFASEGIGRRLPLVGRCVENIYGLYPPDRATFLSRDELSDISIQLHAFAINVYALFDNIAWVCVLEAGETLPPMRVGLFKKQCDPFIPAGFRAYLARSEVREWFDKYGKLYRDSTAHRIPPYLPSRVLLSDEAARFQDLHRQAAAALLDGATESSRLSGRVRRRLEEHEQLIIQRDALGANSLLIALSLTAEDHSPPVYMHPQLVCDWALAQELVTEFASSMRESRSWPQPALPAMVVS